jgi:hypothetical protein
LKPQHRKGAFTSSHHQELIELDGRLGYRLADGSFIVTCDLRRWQRLNAKRAREMLEAFLRATPNMRKLAEAGMVTFSIQGGQLYCHTTLEWFKGNGPGSPGQMQAIDNWRKAHLTPEEYAEVKKNPVKRLEGAELDAWANARYAESERQIASLKVDHSRGRAPKAMRARVSTAQPTAQPLH